MIASLKLFLRWLEWYICSFRDTYTDCGEPSRVLWISVEWRNIDVYTFGNWTKHILYVWGMHGNEVWTVKCMQRRISYLQNNHDVIPKNITIHVIPCLNQDWLSTAKWNPDRWRGWRYVKVNAHWVDLNRNFPTSNRSKDATRFLANAHSRISWGTSPASEPEIKLLLEFIEKEAITTIYSFHNRWGTVMSSYMLKEAEVRTERYAKKSWYRIFSSDEWDDRWDDKKTWHSTIRAQENNISLIEIEMKTRWLSERKRNKPALIDSLYV